METLPYFPQNEELGFTNFGTVAVEEIGDSKVLRVSMF